MSPQMFPRSLARALVVVVALFGAACSSDNDTANDAPSTTTAPATSAPNPGAADAAPSNGSVTPTVRPCAEMIPTSLADNAPEALECGRIVVPLDHGDPAVGAAALAYYRVPATGSDPAPDPVIYLAGGPGGSGLADLPSLLGPLQEVTTERDLVVVDQRGTGLSLPSLACPEGVDDDPIRSSCRDHLRGAGLDLALFNTVQNAQDIPLVATSLGYEQYNLLGVSYGTRLALEVMRDRPNGLRSVVLDSAFPPQINGITGSQEAIYFAIDELEGRCQASPGCAESYPDIRQVVIDGFQRLVDDPVEVPHAEIGGRFTAELYAMLIADLLGLPDPGEIASIVAYGSIEEITELVDLFVGTPLDAGEVGESDLSIEFSDAVANATLCAEDIARHDPAVTPAGADAYDSATQAVVAAAVGVDQIDALCEVWDVPAAPAELAEPVESDVPTLILAGGIDTATPPRWAAVAAEALTDVRVAEFADAGHAVISGDPCAVAAVATFLADAAHDSKAACETGVDIDPNDSPQDQLDDLVEQAVGAADGGMVAQYTPADGATVTSTIGVADADGSALDATTPLRVGSVSKTFVATIVLQLADEGVVDLDAPLSDHVPDVGLGGDLTIRSLLAHTSGAPDYTENGDFWTSTLDDLSEAVGRDEVIGFAEDAEPTTAGEFQYSNTNYFLLGLLIEQVDGGSLDASLQRRIAEPLDLANTYFAGDSGRLASLPAGGFSSSFPVDGSADADYASIASAAWASGALVSTIGDLTLFAVALRDGALVSPDLHAQMLDVEAGYGLGVQRISPSPFAPPGDDDPIGHGGAIPGFLAVIAIGADGSVVTAITNNDDVGDIFSLPHQLLG